MQASWKEQKKRARQGVWDQYESLGQIGQGTYGIVFKAASKNREDKKEYAIKQFKSTPDSDGLSQSACREINLCRELRHDNVVPLRDVILDPIERSISLVFDYAEHDLLQILEYHRDQHNDLPRDMIKSVIWQILNGISYMHANWVLHRDLKPANILLMGTGPECGVVKIADLGLARIFQAPLQPLVVADRVVVTIWYRSPELLLGAKHYTKAVDVWSIGCIFAELLMLHSPFKGKEVKAQANNRNPFQRSQLEKIFDYLGLPGRDRWPNVKDLPEFGQLNSFNKSKYQYQLDRVMAGKVSPSGLALLKRMLEYDPEKRIKAEEALEHDYFLKESPPVTTNAFAVAGGVRAYPKRAVTVGDDVRPRASFARRHHVSLALLTHGGRLALVAVRTGVQDPTAGDANKAGSVARKRPKAA